MPVSADTPTPPRIRIDQLPGLEHFDQIEEAPPEGADEVVSLKPPPGWWKEFWDWLKSQPRWAQVTAVVIVAAVFLLKAADWACGAKVMFLPQVVREQICRPENPDEESSGLVDPAPPSPPAGSR